MDLQSLWPSCQLPADPVRVT